MKKHHVKKLEAGYAVFNTKGLRVSPVWPKEDAALVALRGHLKRQTESEQRTRECICCGRTFISQGPSNRLCPVCVRSPDATSADLETPTNVGPLK